MRRAEADTEQAWSAVHAESAEGVKAYRSNLSRNHTAVRSAEETGYERGLRDERVAVVAWLRRIGLTPKAREYYTAAAYYVEHLRHHASAIEAATAGETRSGSTEGESAAPSGETPNPNTAPTPVQEMDR